MPSIDEVKQLNGKIITMLSDKEDAVYKYYCAQGRKHGVCISVISEVEQTQLVSAISPERAEEILRHGNSEISVVVN